MKEIIRTVFRTIRISTVLTKVKDSFREIVYQPICFEIIFKCFAYKFA